MSGLFPHREHSDPWFRIGRLEVTTVMFVVLVVVSSWLVWVITPAMTVALAYSPGLLAGAEVWRLFTWPLAEGLSGGFWTLISLFFFWYFGTELEGQIGRHRMAWLLVGIWASLTAAYTLASIIFATTTYLFGISLIQFLILLLWIAEYPTRRFLFNIPAWVFGVAIVAIQVLVMLGYRDYAGLLSLLLGLTFVAIAARRSGLLGDYAWIPGRPKPRRPKAPRVPRSQARQSDRTATDRERLDTLLDQISDHGLHSLTEAQRRELKKLSARLRGQGT